MTNLFNNTTEGKFITNVKISKDRKYSQSYNTNIQETTSYAYGIIKGDWIECFCKLGYSEKHKITGKHLRELSFGKEITERTFQLRTKKARKQKVEEQEQQIREQQIEKENLEKEKDLLKENLEGTIASVLPRIKEVITKKQIEQRLIGNMETNEICNRAVGIVGYDKARALGWTYVLKEISNQM